MKAVRQLQKTGKTKVLLRAESTHIGNLGIINRTLGLLAEAEANLHLAIQISQQIDDDKNEGIWYGNVYLNRSKISESIEALLRALSIARDVKDTRNEGTWLGILGIAYAQNRHLNRAIDYYQQALQIHQQLGTCRLKALLEAIWGIHLPKFVIIQQRVMPIKKHSALPMH